MKAHHSQEFITRLLAFSALAVPSLPGSSFVGANSAQKADKPRKLSGLYTGPYFDPSTLSNFTAQLGDTAQMPCRVRQIGTKTVSWIRKVDGHILTVDKLTYISDERFMVIRPRDRDEWNLIIRQVQEKDEGTYECQISTEPKMSHSMFLKVMVPKVEVEGSPDIFAKSGSTVVLKCTVRGSLTDPAFIFWNHNGARVIAEEWPDADIDVRRDAGHGTSGTLTISNLEIRRSGNYTCQPSNLPGSSVNLHVIDAKEQGLRTNNAEYSRTKSRIVFLCTFLLVYIHYKFPRA